MNNKRGGRTPEEVGHVQLDFGFEPLPEEPVGAVIQGTLFEQKVPPTMVGPYAMEGRNVGPNGKPIRQGTRRGSSRLRSARATDLTIPTAPVIRRRQEGTPPCETDYWQNRFDSP